MISKEQLRNDLEEYYSTGEINKKFGPYRTREKASDVLSNVIIDEVSNTYKNNVQQYQVKGHVKEESDGFYVIFKIRENKKDIKKGSK